jgi:hypothetical protein
MSALGQKQTFNDGCPMSALPPNADMDRRGRNGRLIQNMRPNSAALIYLNAE